MAAVVCRGAWFGVSASAGETNYGSGLRAVFSSRLYSIQLSQLRAHFTLLIAPFPERSHQYLADARRTQQLAQPGASVKSTSLDCFVASPAWKMMCIAIPRDPSGSASFRAAIGFVRRGEFGFVRRGGLGSFRSKIGFVRRGGLDSFRSRIGFVRRDGLGSFRSRIGFVRRCGLGSLCGEIGLL